jgi:hypothetical protein
MIAITPTGLQINIKDTAPEERRTWLIKALAASMRALATNPNKSDTDNEYVYALEDLIDNLID